MTKSIQQKREELKALSAGYQMLVKEGAFDSVNTGLVHYYAELGHTTLKSYRGWLKEGFQVKKGSEALLLWGEPKPLHKNEPPKEKKEGEEKEETFFPVAFVFSNLQVEQKKS
jgi:hypothetical protein